MRTGTRRRSTSHRRVIRRRSVAALGTIGLLIGASIGVGEYVRRTRSVPPIQQGGLSPLPEGDVLALPSAGLGASERPIYSYSIIRGGAPSVADLAAAMAGDPIVAQHFSGFDLARARVEPLTQPRLAHVSYRLGNDVFWTRKPVVIPAGERVLTDGERFARTRCGNLLADAPGAVSALEPPAHVLDAPVSPTTAAPLSVQAPAGLTAGLGGISPAPLGPGGLAGGSGTIIAPGALVDPSSPPAPPTDPLPPGSDHVANPPDPGDASGGAPPGLPPIELPPPGPPPGGDPMPPGPVPPEVPPFELPPPGLPPADHPTPPGGLPPGDDPVIVPNDPGPQGPPSDGAVPEPGVSLLMLCATVAFGVRRLTQHTRRL